MQASPHRPRARGAALPLSLVLLAVLTVIAVAAVSLSGQERSNAAAYSRVDFVNECANAAQAKMWGEMAFSGSGYLGAPIQITEVSLPDGTKLVSPAHYDTTINTTLVKDVVMTAKCGAGEVAERDCTNSACGLWDPGSCQNVGVKCIDAQGRELELEIGFKFAL